VLRLLADENFNGDIVRGLLLREKNLAIVRVQDVGLGNASDADVLSWAAEDGRIILTHDRATMPRYAYERLAGRARMSGVFVLDDRFPVGLAIQELLLINACSEQTEWDGQIIFLPL